MTAAILAVILALGPAEAATPCPLARGAPPMVLCACAPPADCRVPFNGVLVDRDMVDRLNACADLAVVPESRPCPDCPRWPLYLAVAAAGLVVGAASGVWLVADLVR